MLEENLELMLVIHELRLPSPPETGDLGSFAFLDGVAAVEGDFSALGRE